MPPLPRWSSHRTRALAVAACVLASWTCDQQAAGPGRRAVLAVEALLPATDLAAFNLTIDNARLIVVSTTGDTVFDKTFSFPANQSSLPVSADVPLDASPAAFHVTIQLLSGTTLLFEGTQDVTLTGETATPVRVPVTYSGPGQNVASLTIDPADSSLSFGASLTFRPTARDAQGNPVTSFYVSWTTSDTVAAPIDATGTLVAPAARQTVTVTAHTPTNVSASTPITFAPVATGIGVVSGCGQTGAPGAQLPQPIVARVVAADGLGVKDVAVTFTPPSGGSVSPAQALTDASGQAQTTATLGATPGPASFTLSAGGLTPATCVQTVLSQATQLAFTTQPPASSVAGALFSVAVTARDAGGNPVTSFAGNVTLALGTNPGGVSFTPVTVAAVAGVATFTGLEHDKVGTGYTLSASATGLTAGVSAPLTISPAAPAHVSFAVLPPTAVTAGVPIAPATTVTVEDAFANVVTTATNTVSVALGANPGGATLGGTTSRAAVAGVATFSTLTIDSAGTGYTLVATSPGLAPDTSQAFNVSAGLATSLAVTSQPAGFIAGSGLGPVVVAALDGQGNVATGFTGNVTIALGTHPAGATLTGVLTVSAASGVATFSNLGGLTVAGSYTLVATSGSLSVESAPFTVSAAAASRLAFSAQPSAAVVGAPIAPVVVAVEDQFGNLANTATNPVTMALGPGSPSGATLGGTKTVAAVNGLAAFTNLTLDIAGTGFTLAASASGLAGATTAPFNVTSLTGGVAWNNPSGGNWSVAANWTPARVPGKSDSVFITLPGTYTVTLDVSDTVAFLTAGGSSGTQTLAVNGRTLGIDSAASVLANAAVNLTTATINGGAGGANVANSGTITVSPGGSTINGTVVINSGGQLVQNGNNGFADLSVSGTVTNAGTIELTGTSWGGRLTVSGGALQDQVGGTLQVVAGTGNTLTAALNNQGTVQVDGPLTINGASATHQNSGAITLGAGNLTLTQSGTTPSFTTTGSVVIGASRILQVNGGTFTYANASPGGLAGLGTVSLSGVTLGLNPDFTVDTLALTMTNSTVNGPGTLHVAATRTLTLTQSTLNAALDNAGTVLGTPGASALNGAVTNQSGALLELNGNNGFADMTVANGFTNDGTIELTGTSWGGRLTVTTSILVNSATGTLQVVAGTGNTLTGALNNQGTVQVDGPLTINKASAAHQNSGTITLGAGNLTLAQSGTTPSFTTTGTVVVGTGRTWAVSGGALNYSGGAIGGDGAMTLSGVTLGLSVTLSHDTLPVSLSVSLTNSTVNGPGTLPVAATSTLTMTGTTVNAPLVNFGTLQSTPGTNVLNGAVTNAPGALLRLNGNNGFADMTVASGFTNAGTIELTGTSWAGRLTVGSPTTPATLTNAVGASLLTTGGSGNVLAGALDNQGTVQVGGPLTLNAPSAGHGNSGLIELAGGDLTVALSGTRPGFSNTGTIDVGTNKMVVSGAGSFINQSTGTLMGSGTFDVSSPNLSFLSNGITTVGGAPGVGLLTFVGTYIMGPTGSINVEIGGTPNPGVTFDQLHADSVVFQSGGTLNAADLGGTAGNNYPVLTSAKAINGGLQVFNIPSNCTPVVSSTQYVLQCR
jgi:hypothetical protein